MIRNLFFVFWMALLVPCNAYSQDISGKWKGYYTESNFRQYQKKFNVEIIFEPLASNLVRFTMNVYSGKVLSRTATGTGIYKKEFNYLLFSQLKINKIQQDNDEAELCYLAFNLSYQKYGRETLTGICRGHNRDKSVCGEGKVYLRRYISKEEKTEIREDRKEKRQIRKSKRKAAKAH